MKNAKRTKAHKESVTFFRLYILSFPAVDESVCEPSCIHHQPHDSPLEERTAATLPSQETPSKPAPSRQFAPRTQPMARSLALSAFKHANRITWFLIDAALGAATPLGTHGCQVTLVNFAVTLSYSPTVQELGKGGTSAQAAFTCSGSLGSTTWSNLSVVARETSSTF